jgi:catechol 2,3-dioxygenase-like lactoylglutathione lyase family enzyme
MIVRLHHAQITIPKGAETEARQFYCQLLGLIEVPKPASLAGRGGFWLQLGETQIHIGTEDGVERTTTKAHVAYEVDDLEILKALFEKQGFKFLDGIAIPDYRRLEIRDPFGNRVEFLQRLSENKTPLMSND